MVGLAARVLKEPLLHFFAAGGMLFAVYAWMGEAATDTGPRQLRIGEGEVRWLSEIWTRQWQRPPSGDELRGLVDELVREELLAREARELGLDQDDTVVRRRLAQKLTFLIEDTAGFAEPSESELQRLYDSEPHHSRDEARISFAHVYFSPSQRTDAEADARSALSELAGRGEGADPAELGDGLMIESEFRDADQRTVAAQLGPEFAEAVFALQVDAWQGPIRSSYGLHLVQVSALKPMQRRNFEDVKETLTERWREANRRELTDRYVEQLLEKYDLVLEDNVKAAIGDLPGKVTVSE